jgi:glucose-1-phosphate cytidylyltransferase
MDTFKDKISFDRMEARGTCPWKVWLDRPTGTVDSGK